MAKTSIACIVIDKRKILIAHRIPKGDMGSRWEFPGGKVENGENDKQAVVREFKEEFGVTVKKVDEQIATAEFRHNGELRDLHAYRTYVPHKGLFFKYKLTEHTEYRWVDIDDIKLFNFVDSDLLLYPDVKNYVISKYGPKK